MMSPKFETFWTKYIAKNCQIRIYLFFLFNCSIFKVGKNLGPFMKSLLSLGFNGSAFLLTPLKISNTHKIGLFLTPHPHITQYYLLATPPPPNVPLLGDVIYEQALTEPLFS